MTVKIKNKEIWKALNDAFEEQDAPANIVFWFLDNLRGDTSFVEDETYTNDIKKIIDAIFSKEIVQLVEPKYLIYVDLPRQFEQFKMAGDGLDRFNTEKLVTYSDYLQFSQSDVDEIKKMYPFIKTKEVEE